MAQKGETIAGRYRLLERLGAGALGEVWAARDDHTERELAVKLLRPRWNVAPKSLDAFFREAKAAARIRHASVVELIDAGEESLSDERLPFVVLELLEAEKLEEVLDRVERLPVGTALRLVSEIAWALVAAHERSIVHERIEPANVLLHRDVRGEIVPKLVDFGIARLIDDLDVLPGTPHEALSPLAYLSPEQIHADVELDGRADVFGLAALLHRCIVGVPPFDAATADGILEQIEEGPKKLEPFEPPIDNKVIQLICDALQRNRKRRPTMRVFAERLDALRERIEAQWDELGALLNIPEERTLEHIAKLRASKVLGKINLVKRAEPTPIVSAREEIAAPASPRVDPREEPEPISVVPESAPDSAPPDSVGERLSSSELEDAPPSIPHPPVKHSVPPPLPKPGLGDAPPISEIIREKMKQTKSDALALDVLADLEKELLKHVGGRELEEPTPAAPDTGLFKGNTSIPPKSDLLYAPAPDSSRTSEPERKKDKPRDDGTSAEPRAVRSLPSATAKTLPPMREEEKKSSAIWIAGAIAAIALVIIIVVQRSNDPATGAAGQPSASAPAATTAAPTPTIDIPPVVTPVPTMTVAPVESVAPIATSAAPAATTAAPVVTAPPPPATTAAPVVTAAPPPTTAPVVKPTAAPVATAKPTATATATASAAPPPKPTNDPTFGVESAGF